MLTLCLYTEEIYIWLLYNFSSTLLLTSRHLHTLLSAYAFSLLLFDMFTSTWENLSVYRRHPLRHCSMYYYWFAAVMGRVPTCSPSALLFDSAASPFLHRFLSHSLRFCVSLAAATATATIGRLPYAWLHTSSMPAASPSLPLKSRQVYVYVCLQVIRFL